MLEQDFEGMAMWKVGWAFHGAELVLKCTLKQEMGGGHLSAYKLTGLQANALLIKSCIFCLLFTHITYVLHIYLFFSHISQHGVVML